ncbi:hypothetical protein DPMN_174865 [Dreissena polymorpha]|uniref:Uncharacterized protein n=1 Tax=Dreissena polymorpha TaxID=45954 RepID=A0A9D4E749_DREPO|nr:hypothetical protein DPMN_174865 [Dreissena polymorpha]
MSTFDTLEYYSIREARGRLWPRYKQLKAQNPRSRVRIVYPEKLIHYGNLIQDELPEWGKYIGANRLLKIDEIGRVKAPHSHGTDSPRSEANVHRPSVHNLVAKQPPRLYDMNPPMPPISRDETTVKSAICDASNPNLPTNVKVPARRRPRQARAEKRSQSAKPYYRDNSQNRPAVKTAAKNSKTNLNSADSEQCVGGNPVEIEQVSCGLKN